ncbi:hypothetical protein [Methylobacterium sp. D54C]
MIAVLRPGAARAIPIATGLLLCTALATPAQAQLLRGALDTTSNGILGTGLTIGTSSPGSGVLGTGLNVGTTSGGLLGTGVTVGTTDPGTGVLGTGLNVGTTSGGVLGTGVLVGTTGPGDGLLGTGLTLGTAGGTGTGGCGTCGGTGGGGTGGGGTGGGGTGGGSNQGIYIITGNVTQSQGQTVINELRLSQLTSVTGVAANNTSNQAAPIAVGSDALAVGYGSSAAGTASTAVGTGASAANTGSVALGYAASAQGLGGTAIGTASAASGAGSTALGFVAGATGTGSTAVGAAASAAGNNSVALGNGAAANQANTIAIGANVKTTQANQVAIGNSANTYRLAGIASQASAAAQSGATAFVTTDANGNLAASAYGPSTIAGLGNRIDSVQAQVNNLEAKTDSVQRYAIQTRKEARQGVAMAIAMATAPMPSAPGKTTWATNGATYRGEWAGGLAVAHRLPTCCVPIAVTAGVAYGGDNAVGVRAGLAGEF